MTEENKNKQELKSINADMYEAQICELKCEVERLKASLRKEASAHARTMGKSEKYKAQLEKSDKDNYTTAETGGGK